MVSSSVFCAVFRLILHGRNSSNIYLVIQNSAPPEPDKICNKVGQWKHANQIPTLKIFLQIWQQCHLQMNFKINSVLSPFKRLLRLKNLLSCGPNNLKKETIVANLWLRHPEKPIGTTLVPYSGPQQDLNFGNCDFWGKWIPWPLKNQK